MTCVQCFSTQRFLTVSTSCHSSNQSLLNRCIGCLKGPITPALKIQLTLDVVIKTSWPFPTLSFRLAMTGSPLWGLCNHRVWFPLSSSSHRSLSLYPALSPGECCTHTIEWCLPPSSWNGQCLYEYHRLVYFVDPTQVLQLNGWFWVQMAWLGFIASFGGPGYQTAGNLWVRPVDVENANHWVTHRASCGGGKETCTRAMGNTARNSVEGLNNPFFSIYFIYLNQNFTKVGWVCICFSITIIAQNLTMLFIFLRFCNLALTTISMLLSILTINKSEF